MKKTLLSVLAAVSVIGAASAVPSAADRKAMCESKPDKYVWVEKNQACVVRSACDNDRFSSYCSKTFSSTQTSSEQQAYRLVNMYLMRKNNGEKCEEIKLRDGDPNNIGQDYVQCTTQDGYYEFEFDDVSESFASTAQASILEAICINIYNGHNFVSQQGSTQTTKYGLPTAQASSGDGYICYGISQENCREFGYSDTTDALLPGTSFATSSEYDTESGLTMCNIFRMI